MDKHIYSVLSVSSESGLTRLIVFGNILHTCHNLLFCQPYFPPPLELELELCAAAAWKAPITKDRIPRLVTQQTMHR